MNPRFGIGQRVHLSLGIIHPGKTVTCHIVELLPSKRATSITASKAPMRSMTGGQARAI